MFSELKNAPTAWKKAWSNPTFRNQFLLSFLMLIGVSLHNFYYLRIFQGRQGMLINDYVLALLPPHDFSAIIFGLEYFSILLAIFFVFPNPVRFVKGLQMFSLVIFARTASVYLLPLEPPTDMVPLYDPVANVLLNTHGVFVTKDLFFSGHVSACFMLFLIMDKWYLKVYTLGATLLVGLLIMWQHVHYSTDVLFAPLFSYGCYWIINWMHTRRQFAWTLAEA